jgi:hypothetical protein
MKERNVDTRKIRKHQGREETEEEQWHKMEEEGGGKSMNKD